MLEKIIKLVFCHMVGDYALQNDFIAQSKGSNWYHLIVHCILYCLPFYIVFGNEYHLEIVFFMHIIIDALKARYKTINYVEDQFLHFAILLIIYLL